MAKEAQQLVVFTTACMMFSVCMAATTTNNVGNSTLSGVDSVQKILEILVSKARGLNQISSTRSFGDECDFPTIAAGGESGVLALISQCNPGAQGMVCSPDSTCQCFDSNELLVGASYKAVRDYIISISGLTDELTDEVLQNAAKEFLIKGEYDSESKTCLATEDSLCTNQAIPELPGFKFNCIKGLECKQLDDVDLPVGKCSGCATLLFSSIVAILSVVMHLIS